MKQMNKQFFTLKRLEIELSQSRQNIKRRLDKLGIKALNEDNRSYKTQPLEYSYETFIILVKEFDVQLSSSKDTSNEELSLSNDELVNNLIKELKSEKKRLEDKLDKAEDRHEKQLAEAYELTRRQQELNMKDRLKIEELESRLRINNSSESIQDVEAEEKKQENVYDNKKPKWYEFWK